MKKKITSLLLTLALCLGLGLVPAAALAANADETLTAEEAESKYGISISPSHIDFGSCFVGNTVEPITITVTNNGSHTVDLDYRGGLKCDDKALHVYGYGDKDLAPGESRDLKVRLDTWREASGTAHMEAKLLLDGFGTYYAGPGGIGVGKDGTALDISDFLTVDYEVKALSDADAGDIAWELSDTFIDFGTSDVADGHHPSQEKALTVTNRGSLPYVFDAVFDLSACERANKKDLFYKGISGAGSFVRPGESTKIRVSTASGYQIPGKVEGCVLKLTAYYPDSKEKNTLTAEIPLSIKYLTDGGYQVYNLSDNSFGTVKTSDGIDRGPYSGNNRFTAKEGSSVTFVMTPYDPAAYHVSDIKINGESVGTAGMVGNTYTISNVQASMEFEAVFAPGADPSAQQPQTPVQPPVEPSDELPAWAEGQVKGAISQGLVPQELQGGYNLVTTRAQFCSLAVRLYESVKGEITGRETFTDTDDVNVQKMAALGVVSGVGGGAFIPDGPLTREQAATILARLSNAMGKPLSGGSHPFIDGVASWADAAVGQVYQAGIMNGTGNTTFSPQGEYTRMQSIVTIMRLYGMIK